MALLKACGRVVVCAILTGSMAAAAPAGARVLLKPQAQQSAPLSAKSITADVTIDRQFATAKLEMAFANELSQRIEADFIYELPEGAVATYFAYWFGDEKVIARIVEKERAAAIYGYITSRMRDPALVEMLDKRTFRARIFPVMPHSDLKVEIHMAQVLPSEQGGPVYQLPLGGEEDEPAALESLQVNVRVRADESIQEVANNYGLAVTAEDDSYRVTLSGANYRPPKDLRVRLVRKKQPLHVALYAAPSGGRDGFFALALTTDHSLTKPRVTIRGVSAYHVVPMRLPDVSAHHAVTLCGRYRGSGEARVTLSGRSPIGWLTYSENVVFGSQREANNIATKLWAAGRIEQLSASEANRLAVIALSTRFCLPSKFTSWLAVPRAEMERYRREMLEADLWIAARELASLIATGRDEGQRGKELRARLDSLCDELHRDPREVLRGELHAAMWDTARALAAEKYKPWPSMARVAQLRRELGRLARETGESASECEFSAEAPYLRDEPRRLAEELSQLILAGREKSSRGQQLMADLRRFCRLTERDPHGQLREFLYPTMMELGKKIVRERREPQPDTAHIARLTRELERLAQFVGEPADYYVYRGARRIPDRETAQVRNQLAGELGKEPQDGPRITQLEAEFIALNQKDCGQEYAETRAELLRTNVQIDRLRPEGRMPTQEADAERLAQLRERAKTLRARMGDPLISAEAPADAQQVIALLPSGEVRPLAYNREKQRWEARFDIPVHAPEGEYVITIIVVLSDGTRNVLTMRYRVDLTPPTGAGEARVVRSPEPTFRLEVETSEDTARAAAILPWGERVELTRSAEPGHYFALAPVPPEHQAGPLSVTLVLTDRAHNRTVLTVNAGSG